jgi:hypothetical protein
MPEALGVADATSAGDVGFQIQIFGQSEGRAILGADEH